MRRLTTKEKLIYGSGNFGMGIMSGMAMFWMVYFFFPPADANIPYTIPQGSIFMGLTVIGLILGINRLVDAVTDPWIATVCDHSTNPRGKYTPMMLWGSPGVMFFMAAIYFVPDAGQVTMANVVWISVAIALNALCATMYGIPYYALQVRIAPHTDDKLDLNTIMGAFWFTGLVLASFSSFIWDFYQASLGMGKVESMQWAISTIACLGLVFLVIPPLFINENDYPEVKFEDTVRPKFFQTVKLVSKDKIYTRFLLIVGLYYVATFMFETGMTYFLTVLAELEESSVGIVTSITGVLCMLCYPLVNYLGKKEGKKRLLLQGFALFGVTLALIATLGMGPIPAVWMIGLIVLLSPLPQAIMGILPGTLTADIADYARRKTGQDNSSIYMAGNMFMNKLAGTFTMLVFTSFLLMGKDVGDDFGIRAVALFALAICIFAFFVARTYDEDEVMKYQRADAKAEAQTQAETEAAPQTA